MLIRQGSHCEKHAVLAQQQREKHLQAVHARYNQRRDESDGFYKTERWKRLAARYRRLHPICEECDEAPSQITDHIKARKTHPELSLVWSNLRALCRACHNRVGERVGRIENGADPGAPRMPRIGALNRPGEGGWLKVLAANLPNDGGNRIYAPAKLKNQELPDGRRRQSGRPGPEAQADSQEGARRKPR
ncbi:HNH endonuclease [Pseudomonas aeruginosa]